MKCIRCNTENIDALAHCEKCGAPLRMRRHTDKFRKRKMLLVFLVLLCWLGGFTFFFRDILFWQNASQQHLTEEERSDLLRKKQQKRKELTDRLRAVMANDEESPGDLTPAAENETVAQEDPQLKTEQPTEKEIIAGWISIFDPWERQVTRFRSTATLSGWVAIPSRSSLAGNRWVFYADYGREAHIEQGLWSSGDNVGLWKLSSASGPAGASLAAWNSNEPVDWISVESQNKQSSVPISPKSQQGNYILASIPSDFNEIGVLTQNTNIVGWTFGQWLKDAYLWNGRSGGELIEQVSSQSFYNETFGGGREEQFAKALSIKESVNSEERLRAFIDGFRLSPKLNLIDTPYYLHPEEINKQIRILASQMIHSGNGVSVANLLDSSILKSIGDISLFMDIIPAFTSSRGYEAAINEIETTGSAIVDALQVNVPALNEQHVTLYQEWLQSLVTVSATSEGFDVYAKATAFYPDDPYLHLLGVELELLHNDWQAAEEMLYSREYPESLLDRYQLLAKRISEMKGEEGKIVIRFSPGSSRIPVSASINESLYQDFLVDTGASLVTIPYSTAENLGLELVTGHHGGERMVSTAGGVVSASEVIIDALEIGGWTEYNVRALILDIPEQTGLGLLGLNYLGRFKMDLNSADGVLLLSPK